MIPDEQSVSNVPPTLSRRTVLAAIGTGAAAGLAGCLGSASTGSDDPATAADTATPTSNAHAVHPRWGFVGEAMDTPAPVEADHRVELLIAEREDGPIPEFYFEPAGLFVESGDVIEFVFATPDHGVTAFHPGLGRTQRLPDGVPALSSPTMTAGTYWLYRFETPGVYDLYCPPHEPFGMVMRVVVDEAGGPATALASTEPVGHGQPRPPLPTAAAVLNDDALAPENVIEEGAVGWAEIADESKALRE